MAARLTFDCGKCGAGPWWRGDPNCEHEDTGKPYIPPHSEQDDVVVGAHGECVECHTLTTNFMNAGEIGLRYYLCSPCEKMEEECEAAHRGA